MSKVKWLRSHVERCLQDIWDECRVEKDSDGDYPFRYGSTQGFVRIEPGQPDVVRVFAYASLDTPRSAKLLTELNDVASRCRTVSLRWRGGAVIVEQVLQANAVKRSTLRQAFQAVSFVADDIGTLIATVYGGATPYAPGDAEITEQAN